MTGNEIRRRFLEHFASREHLVLPSAPLVPHGDPSTLFISAGMQPLQPYYLGLSEPPAPRLASAQKCLRTGDIDEVGKTDRHNTFFEMLGNFAPTGDYFKETAIPLAWELVTTGFAMPVDRLRVTVHPSDDASFEIWTSQTGIAAEHVTRLADNWWGLGRGPCGPDTEIWWDKGREAGCGQPDCYPDHCARFTEFWNLVLPEYDQRADLADPPTTAEAIKRGISEGALVRLARPAIDTGMGLERISFILQGKGNLFESDLFEPLMNRIRELADKPNAVSERIVADHVRAASFVMLEPVAPSNEGRGYVLRRLIRRAALHGQRMRMHSQVGDLVDEVAAVMGEAYPELVGQKNLIRAGINQEAARFQRTVEQGLEQFERILSRSGTLVSGADAFRLHDSWGFPIELTRELASERGASVDEGGFSHEMAAQRDRSRSSFRSHMVSIRDVRPSRFVGYTKTATRTRIQRLRHTYGDERLDNDVQEVQEGDTVLVCLDETPFYAEAGGQVGDTGTITGPNGVIRVEDTQKIGIGGIAHLGVVERGTVNQTETVSAEIDVKRRTQIARHHTATHLLHKALREALGPTVVQKGSWVGPDHTTFDIPLDRAMSLDELTKVNRLISEKVREHLSVKAEEKPFQEAIASGAMHLFEEKYGETVRVVCAGDWTCELCGGTHVKNTADIGTAVIVSESSIGSGLRRIDMVVGEAADELVRRDRELLTDLGRSFNVSPSVLPQRIEALRAQLKEAEREREKLRRERIGGDGMAVRHGRVDYVAETVDATNVDELKSYADRYLEKVKSGIVTVVAGDKFVIKVSKDLTAQYDANRLKDLFGKGGGPSHLVTGTLTVPADEAFKRLERELGSA